MGALSRQEAAERAGVSLDELGRLVELGVLTPADGDQAAPGII